MRVYLDNNATTPPDPRVTALMQQALTRFFGNPASSSHVFGWEAEECVKMAREHVAALVGVRPEEIYFTSGATESINLALLGFTPKPTRIFTTKIEHKATLDTCEQLKAHGTSIEFLPVNSKGVVSFDTLKKLCLYEADLVSIIGAQNEIGTIQDIAQITELAAKSNTPCHFDLTQMIGKVEANFKGLGVRLASFSAHKIYGPKGVGALFIDQSLASRVAPLLFGGGHERGIRSGTLNVPGIVGFGEACRIVKEEIIQDRERISGLTDLLFTTLKNKIPAIVLHGEPKNRIVGNLNIAIPKLPSSTLLSKLASSVAMSSSSACTSGDASGSYVLKALGVDPDLLKCSVRIGVGRFNTKEEILFASDKIVECYNRYA